MQEAAELLKFLNDENLLLIAVLLAIIWRGAKFCLEKDRRADKAMMMAVNAIHEFKEALLRE